MVAPKDTAHQRGCASALADSDESGLIAVGIHSGAYGDRKSEGATRSAVDDYRPPPP